MPAYLLGTKRLPKQHSPFSSVGSAEGAVLCAEKQRNGCAASGRRARAAGRPRKGAAMTEGARSIQEVARQLHELGVLPGAVLEVHTSFRAVRPVEDGPRGLIAALRRKPRRMILDTYLQ